jgi:hypothetical protein
VEDNPLEVIVVSTFFAAEKLYKRSTYQSRSFLSPFEYSLGTYGVCGAKVGLISTDLFST